jgi:hypothetical protein
MIDKWEDIFFYLDGSCVSLTQALDSFNASHLIDDINFLQALDDRLFLCDSCGWWCPVEEKVDTYFCEDCCAQNE